MSFYLTFTYQKKLKKFLVTSLALISFPQIHKALALPLEATPSYRIDSLHTSFKQTDSIPQQQLSQQAFLDKLRSMQGPYLANLRVTVILEEIPLRLIKNDAPDRTTSHFNDSIHSFESLIDLPVRRILSRSFELPRHHEEDSAMEPTNIFTCQSHCELKSTQLELQQISAQLQNLKEKMARFKQERGFTDVSKLLNLLR